MADIPLENALIAWDMKTGEVLVGQHPEQPSSKTRRLPMSWGCFKWHPRCMGSKPAHWHLRHLFAFFVQLTTCAGIDPRVLHEALLVIPEYRKAVNGYMFYDGQPVTGVTHHEREMRNAI